MSSSLSTVGEIKAEFIVRQSSATTTAQVTDTMLSNWLDQGHKYSAGWKKWPMTEGRSATSYTSLLTDDEGLLYGNYPEGWKLRSIRFMRIGGDRYDKKDFFGFMKFLEDTPSANDKLFTDYGRLYYVNAQANGGGTVSVWGQFVPTIDTTDTAATTIFSGTDEDGNLAIVELMQSYAMTREKKEDEAKLHLEKAQAILDGVWKKFTDEGFAYQQSPSNEGMFKRIDVARGALRDDLFKRDQFGA